MYKVITSYEPDLADDDDDETSEFLRAEKGDIIIDGEFIDDIWFKGKNTLTEKRGKIPRDHVVSFISGVNRESLVFTYSDVEGENLNSSYAKEQQEQEDPVNGDDSDVCDSDEILAEPHKRRESNYVDMSSDETINEVAVEVQSNVNPLPKPPRVNDGTKLTDEGYNSGSYYSGEANETIQPLLSIPAISKQDEAGYEVPQISVDVDNESTTKSVDGKGKRRLLRGIFRSRTFDSSKNGHKVDDMSEKYYNPPADIRDHYFLPKSHCPIVRVLLSLIAALAVAFTALFVLLISLNPLLSFCISFVLFIVVFVVPVTLLHQGFVCVLALIFPSMFSTRTKIAGIILLVVLLMIGPIIGIANKLNLATTCNNQDNNLDNKNWLQTSDSSPSISTNARYDRYKSPLPPIQEKCINSFRRVSKLCGKVYKDLQRDCSSYQGKMSSIDAKLCKMDKEEFCYKNSTFVSSCSGYTPKGLHSTESVRDVLFYLIPVLILFLLSDAYMYNKVYLTTKNADNIYITQRLKELDCERKHRGLTDLILPLTRIEFQTYLIRGRLALSKAEKAELIKWFITLTIFGFISLCFILVEDHIHMALLNSLVVPCRKIYENNADIEYRVYIYILIGVFLFITIVQSYVLRLRSIICDHFYPDMVDIRAKHLYYKILHDRHSFGRHIRRKIQLLSEAKRLTRRISCLNMIYHTLPAGLKWLCTKLSVKKCMICDSITYWKTVGCREGICQAHYCYECYVDAGQQCLTCKIPNSPPPAPTSLPIPVAV